MLDLAPPDWAALVGGSGELKWLAARDWKAVEAIREGEEHRQLFERLKAREAVFRADSDLLREEPFAAVWYSRLSGFSMKSLKNIREAPSIFGVSLGLPTIVAGLMEGRPYDDELLGAFCRFINAQIDAVHPVRDRSDDAALHFVLTVLGGTIIGRQQNEGGTEAVRFVKNLVTDGLAGGGTRVDFWDGIAWAGLSEGASIADHACLRFGGCLEADFTGGGNRPDLEMKLGEDVLLVAEIKGRMDLSNVWESWMPQTADHMRSWAMNHPSAARIYLGTLVTQEMIDGASAQGTEERTGLKQLFDEHALTTAFNITKIRQSDPEALAGWQTFMEVLRAKIEVGPLG